MEDKELIITHNSFNKQEVMSFTDFLHSDFAYFAYYDFDNIEHFNIYFTEEEQEFANFYEFAKTKEDKEYLLEIEESNESFFYFFHSGEHQVGVAIKDLTSRKSQIKIMDYVIDKSDSKKDKYTYK